MAFTFSRVTGPAATGIDPRHKFSIQPSCCWLKPITTPRRNVTGLSGEKVTTPEEEGAQSRYRKAQTQDGKVGYIASIYLAKQNYQHLTQKVPLIAQPEHVANEQSDTQPSIVLCEVSEKKASLWNT